MKHLFLYETSFLWTNEKEGLIYNTKTKSHYHFSLSDSDINKACTDWKILDKLYSTIYDETKVSSEFLTFSEAIISKGLGGIAEDGEKMVSFFPQLNIIDSVEKIHNRDDQWNSVPVLNYLSRIVAFLGGTFDQFEKYKQIFSPLISNELLEPSRFFAFIKECNSLSIAHIDLFVSCWNESLIAGFADGLSDIKEKTRFFFADPYPGFNNLILEKLEKSGFTIIHLCVPDSKFNKADWVKGREYRLLVRNDNDVEYWESLLGEESGVNYEFKPIADNNLEFFRKNVFLSEEEILSQNLTKKDIFRHQALNVNQFGTFYIFPDGTIHPASDAPAIGTLEDSVHQTIIRELEENHAWRQTRRLMEPCKNCIYHDLCPSPSVYERILGVPGCTYWKE